MLVAHSADLAAIKQCHSVEQMPAIGKDRTDEHRRAAIRSGRRQPDKLCLGACNQGGFQHQILRRITNELQFRKKDKISVCRLCTPGKHCIGIAAKITNPLGNLDKGDRKHVSHRIISFCAAQ